MACRLMQGTCISAAGSSSQQQSQADTHTSAAPSGKGKGRSKPTEIARSSRIGATAVSAPEFQCTPLSDDSSDDSSPEDCLLPPSKHSVSYGESPGQGN